MKLTLRVKIVMLLAVLLPSWAAGQDESVNPLYPYPLDTVTVTTERLSSEIGAHTFLDSARISAIGSNSMGSLLRLAPGGIIIEGKKGEAEFRIRGARSRDTRLYIDGRPVASPWHGYIDFASIPSSGIGAITIVKGPPPPEYGSCLGGVVNITTVPPKSEPTTHIGFYSGSGGLLETDFSQSGRIGPLSARVDLFYARRDGFPLPSSYQPQVHENGGLRDNSDNNRYGGSVKLYLSKSYGDFTFSSGFTSLERGIPPVESGNKVNYWRFKDWNSYYFDLKYDVKSLRNKITSRLYLDVYGNRLKLYSDSTYSEDVYIYDSTHDSKILGWNFSCRRELTSKVTVIGGCRAHYDMFNRAETIPDPLDSLLYIENPQIYNHSNNIDFFTDGSWKITPALAASIGAAILSRMGDNDALDDMKIYGSLRLGLSFSPVENAQLALNIARSVQFPTFRHLFDNNSGNLDLLPETAWRGEIGGDFFQSSRLNFGLWLFYSEIYDRIDRFNKSNPFINLPDSRLWGEEFSLDYTTTKSTLSLNILHQKAEYIDTPGSDITLEGNDSPEWEGNLFLSGRPLDKTEISFNVRGVSSRKNLAGDNIEGYAVMNISAGYWMTYWMRIRLSVENLLDEEYEEEFGFPQPGRLWKVGIAMNRAWD